jgi:hypothetical protein
MGTSENSFLLRTAAISSRSVVGSKFVLDVALATTTAILNLRLARENFAHSRNKSNFQRLPYYLSAEMLLEISYARKKQYCIVWIQYLIDQFYVY